MYWVSEDKAKGIGDDISEKDIKGRVEKKWVIKGIGH